MSPHAPTELVHPLRGVALAIWTAHVIGDLAKSNISHQFTISKEKQRQTCWLKRVQTKMPGKTNFTTF